MPITIAGNTLTQGKYNNYLLGGNVCNAFALGELGSSDNFFLVGVEPQGESNYPLLTGNILDSEGNVLFRLVRNILVFNPGHCSKVLSDHIGYEIHDGNGHLVFKVTTGFEKLPYCEKECFLTTISANFFNKDGELVFQSNSKGGDERIKPNCKSVLGFSGEFDFIQGFNDDEKNVARVMLTTGGTIHKVLTGHITEKVITIDDTALLNTRIENCKIHITTGNFAVLGKEVVIANNDVIFHGAAENIRQLILNNQN